MIRIILSGVLLMMAPSIQAQNTPDQEPISLTVGVREIPPFAYRGDDQEWTGISVAVWREIAAEQAWEITWKPSASVQDQVGALQSGEIDVAIGAMSMTPERERVIDFSHSFYTTSLAIATPERDTSWWGLLKQLLSPAFFKAVIALTLLLFAVGSVIWVIERRRNPEQFGGTILQGLGNGFWWSAVTMTTVGYGDKAPTTGLGRIIATVWMFFSVITISGFTAAIASSVTLDSSKTRVTGLNDLGQVRTVAVQGSTGAKLLAQRHIAFRSVDGAAEGLLAVQNDQADAFVFDDAILRFLIKDEAVAPVLIPVPGTAQNYAFGLRADLPQTEAINRRLLSILGSPEWMSIRQRYFGAQAH